MERLYNTVIDIMNVPIFSNKTHFLNDKWDLYYHLPNDNNWELNSYKIIMKQIENAETLISLNEMLEETTIKTCMLFIMRNGIKPQWEDPNNRNGGCFSFKIVNKNVKELWKEITYSLCGETLCVDNKNSKLINGITISPKKNFCIIKIWLKNCSVQDPNIIIDLPNLRKYGCLFKKHEPEF